MQPLRLGSLFSGYGGLDIAVEGFFGAETAWHCQYEPPDKKGREDPHQYPAAILAQHWPGVPNLGDVTAVDWDQVEPVDILTGGFPCTDVSLAGRRAGLNDGTRSGLWAHMARAIAVLRPSLVVIENVRGLLSADADRGVEPGTASVDPATGQPLTLRALGAVLGDLAGLGFDAEWASVRASDVGAPHQRERVFVLAWPSDAEGPRLEVRGLLGRPSGGGRAAADADQLGAHRPGSRRAGRHEPADHGQPAADADRDGVRIESVAQPRCGSEAVAELAGLNTAANTGRGGRGSVEPDVQQGEPDAGRRSPADTEGIRRGEGRPEPARLVRGPDAALGGREASADADVCGRRDEPGLVGGERPAEHLSGDRHGIDWGAYEPAIRRWEHVLGRPAPRPVDDRGRLSPALAEWMMGLPASWLTVTPPPPGMTESQIRNAQLKAAGNGVVPQQAYAALGLLWQRATSAPVSAAA